MVSAWQDALDAPNYTLTEVADRVESRLFANLDGLAIGGKPVYDKLLKPALIEAIDGGYTTAAALVLLGNGNADDMAAVLDAAVQAEDEQRKGLIRAISIAKTTAPLVDALQKRFSSASTDDERALWLTILNAKHLLPSAPLEMCLISSNTTLLVAAINTVGIHYSNTDRARYEPLVHQRMISSTPDVQYAAIACGLVMGLDEAWQLCVTLAGSTGTHQKKYLALVALLSTREEFTQLVSLLQEPSLSETTLWCMGLTGDVASIAHCISFLDSPDPRLAKLAAEAISNITGLDMTEKAFQIDATLDTDDDETAESNEEEIPIVDPVESLELPNPDAVKAWWSTKRAAFFPGKRYVKGNPMNADTLRKVLEIGPMRLREPLAAAMRIRTGGARHLSTHAFTTEQRKQLGKLASLQDGEFVYF